MNNFLQTFAVRFHPLFSKTN